jgi:hypothetical protein
MLRRLATASRKEVEEAILVLLCWVLVDVKVRDRVSLEDVVLAIRGETNGFCRRGRRLLNSVGSSSGADMAVWGL